LAGIDDLPPLREVIRDHALRAEKKFGQNFLLDLNLTDKIVRCAGDLNNCTAVEIGPGPGALTRSLLKSEAKGVIAIELDRRALEALEAVRQAAGDRFTLIHGDALEKDIKQIAPSPRAIVANLPYNIATPLLINWLRDIDGDNQSYRSMTLMFQKEVAQRITAAPGDKLYGRLSVLCQWLCETRRVFDVPPSAFVPPPKVMSSIVHFRPKEKVPDAPAFETVEKLTAAAFGQRRKMIRSALKNYLPAVQALGLDETQRAENLTVTEYIALAKEIEKNEKA
jgi:16S rRNA (adenine1518-N6/adenine1519-N6)-dimethyltransferase